MEERGTKERDEAVASFVFYTRAIATEQKTARYLMKLCFEICVVIKDIGELLHKGWDSF